LKFETFARLVIWNTRL